MKSCQERKVFPYLGLVLGILSLGFSAIFVQLAQAPGTVLNFYRMGIAAVLFALPFGIQLKGRSAPLPRKAVRLAVLAGMVFAVDLALWSTGVNLSGATNPTLLANTAPIWVGLGSQIFLGERRGTIFWVGLALALTGSALILGQDALQSDELGLGTLLGLIGSFFYGGYFLLTQRGRESLNSLNFFWIVAASATVTLLVFTLIFRHPLLGYSRNTYLNFIALGVVVQVLGWFSINYAQGYLPAAIVAPTLLGQPVMTAILSYLLLGEAFTILQIGAGLIVILGVFFVHRSKLTGLSSVNGQEGASAPEGKRC